MVSPLRKIPLLCGTAVLLACSLGLLRPLEALALHPVPGPGPGPGPPSSPLLNPGLVQTGDADFIIAETLMTPTHEGVTLRMTPRTDVVAFVRYGTSAQRLDSQSMEYSLTAGQPLELILKGLQQNTRYFYRVHVATVASSGRFLPRALHSFQTLPQPGRPFSFAYATDSHHYEAWADMQFAAKPGAQQRFQKTIANIRKRKPHWLMIGGDFVQTQCSCEGGTHEGVTYAPGSAFTVQEAQNRYDVSFGPDEYGQITSDIPFVYVLGNHDGEGGWFSNALRSSSETARLNTFTNPAQVYPGDAEGHYYAFESGDALIVVIDVMRFTVTKPQTANDWTLGDAQMLWLSSVLSASQAKWKFLFAEHLDGGEPTPLLLGANYYYGRGGLRATVDDPSTPLTDETNKVTGVFKGEQAVIQLLEEQHTTNGGATFFLSGHDHLAITPTEKLDAAGQGTRTFHVKGGRAGYYGASWAQPNSFKKEMDWDGNGVADYDEPALGSRQAGFFLIHVNGQQSVTFEYILTNTQDESLDNTVGFSRTIQALDR